MKRWWGVEIIFSILYQSEAEFTVVNPTAGDGDGYNNYTIIMAIISYIYLGLL